MTIEIAMRLSGFLFLLILVLNIAMSVFGNKAGIGDTDSDAKLGTINDDQKKFKIGIVLGLIEHLSIIALAIMLFIAFSSYNILLGIVWIIFRTGEALIFIYNETRYWGLLSIARQYAGTSGAEKDALSDLGRDILRRRNARYNFALILFSIGTLAYSILFITYGVVPPIIGWLGMITGIFLGLGCGIRVAKPHLEALSIFGLLAIIFEVILGGWLLFFPHTIS
jgi:hypothetical protein